MMAAMKLVGGSIEIAGLLPSSTMTKFHLLENGFIHESNHRICRRTASWLFRQGIMIGFFKGFSCGSGSGRVLGGWRLDWGRRRCLPGRFPGVCIFRQ